MIESDWMHSALTAGERTGECKARFMVDNVRYWVTVPTRFCRDIRGRPFDAFRLKKGLLTEGYVHVSMFRGQKR
jgi:hypothetical protein